MRAVLPLLLLLCVSCKEQKEASPEEAYARFARAAQQGDAKAAYAMLSTPTHQAIEERVRALSAASAGALRDDPAQVTLGTGAKSAPLNEVKLIRQEGDRAEVEGTSGGQARRVGLVREAGLWKVDLSEQLKK